MQIADDRPPDHPVAHRPPFAGTCEGGWLIGSFMGIVVVMGTPLDGVRA